MYLMTQKNDSYIKMFSEFYTLQQNWIVMRSETLIVSNAFCYYYLTLLCTISQDTN